MRILYRQKVRRWKLTVVQLSRSPPACQSRWCLLQRTVRRRSECDADMLVTVVRRRGTLDVRSGVTGQTFRWLTSCYVLSLQRAYTAEAEVVSRRDDVIESRVSQLNVLRRRIDDVISLRVDAVKEVSRCLRREMTTQVSVCFIHVTSEYRWWDETTVACWSSSKRGC